MCAAFKVERRATGEAVGAFARPQWLAEISRARLAAFPADRVRRCIGPFAAYLRSKWLKGITARRAALRSAGIPRVLVKCWNAARRRRTKTIRKLAEPQPV